MFRKRGRGQAKGLSVVKRRNQERRKSKSPVLPETSNEVPQSPVRHDGDAAEGVLEKSPAHDKPVTPEVVEESAPTPRSADAAEVLLSLGQMWLRSPTSKQPQSPSKSKRSPWVVTPMREKVAPRDLQRNGMLMEDSDPADKKLMLTRRGLVFTNDPTPMDDLNTVESPTLEGDECVLMDDNYGLLEDSNFEIILTDGKEGLFEDMDVSHTVAEENNTIHTGELLPTIANNVASVEINTSTNTEDLPTNSNNDVGSSLENNTTINTEELLPTNGNNDIESSEAGLQDTETHDMECSNAETASPERQLNITPLPTPVKTLRTVLSLEFCMSQSEDEFRRLTGLYQPQFVALLEFLGKDVADVLKYRSDRETPKRKKKADPVLCTETRLLITLLRMRRGWDVEDLALFFGISTFIVSKTIYTWVQFMYFQFKRLQGPMFVSRHLQKRVDRPKAFKDYDKFRVCIDTTEVRIQSPDNLEQQGNTYSDYKAGNVWLYLIGISCWGGISFLSPGFEGSMSDVDIYNQSGIREFLERGDVVLADRGFRVQEECDEDGVVLIHPPFLRGRSQFTPEEELLTKEVAKSRIFVEHLVRKIKVFKILKKVTNTMLHYLDQLVYVAACLINFMPHVVKNKPKEDDSKKKITQKKGPKKGTRKKVGTKTVRNAKQK